jgi:hypothetical protein
MRETMEVLDVVRHGSGNVDVFGMEEAIEHCIISCASNNHLRLVTLRHMELPKADEMDRYERMREVARNGSNTGTNDDEKKA